MRRMIKIPLVVVAAIPIFFLLFPIPSVEIHLYGSPRYAEITEINLGIFQVNVLYDVRPLEPPGELSKQEKFDLLTSECKLLFQNTLRGCRIIEGGAQGCFPIYNNGATDKDQYCVDMYVATKFTEDECRILHGIYLERWKNTSISREWDFEKFSGYYCAGL